jgi:hypothetical protein
MRKLLAILLALSMVLSFAACGKGESTDGETDGKGDKATANEDSATKPEFVEDLSEEDIGEKYREFMAFLETAEGEEVYMIFSEEMMKIEGIDDDSLTPLQGMEKFEQEIKDAFSSACDGYITDEDCELYGEFFYITMKITSLFEDDDIRAEIEDKDIDFATEEGKEKLTEFMKDYIPEWFVDSCFGIVIDEIAKNATTKTCAANKREIMSQVNNELMINGTVISSEVQVTINSNGDVSASGSGITAEEFCDMFNEVPCCPTGGTYVVTVSPAMDEQSLPEIEVTCDDPNHEF